MNIVIRGTLSIAITVVIAFSFSMYNFNIVRAETTELEVGHNEVGLWSIDLIEHFDINGQPQYTSAGSVKNEDIIEGFTYNQTGYSWNGAFLRTEALEEVYGLVKGRGYEVSISLKVNLDQEKYANNPNKEVSITLGISNGIANMHATTKTAKNGDVLTWEGKISPSGNGKLLLSIGYGNNVYGMGTGSGGAYGDFTIQSLDIVDKGELAKSDWRKIYEDDVEGWHLFSKNEEYSGWADSDYRVDESASGISRVQFRKNYIPPESEIYDYEGKYSGSDYATYEFEMDPAEVYEGSIVIHTNKATERNQTLKIYVKPSDHFSHELSVKLKEGDNLIKIPRFRTDWIDTNEYPNNEESKAKVELTLEYMMLPQFSEFYVKSADIKNACEGYTPVEKSYDIENEENYNEVNPQGTPWTFVSLWKDFDSYHRSNDSYYEGVWGDIRYKVAGDPNDISSTNIILASTSYAIGDYGPGGQKTEHFYWNFAKLYGYLDKAKVFRNTRSFLGLEVGRTYTGKIEFNYKGVSEKAKPELIYAIPGANIGEKTIDVKEGINTININEFTYDATDKDIVFEFDGLETGSEFNVKSITFSDVLDPPVPDKPDDVKPDKPDDVKPDKSQPNNISEDDIDKAIKNKKDEGDIKGSEFGLLGLKTTKQTKNSIKLKWKKINGSKKYVIYGNRCGITNRYKRITSVKGTSKNLKKVLKKKIKRGKYYKFLVVAIDANKNVITISKTIHVATKGGKIGNHKSVKTAAKKGKVDLTIGKTFKLKAKAIPKYKKKKIRIHRNIAYESSNTDIATIDKKGIITAKKTGMCYVYAYAQCGVCKRVRINVKK